MFTMDLGAPGKRLPKSILIRRDRSGAAGGLGGTAPAFPGVLWHDRRLAPDSFWREGHSGGVANSTTSTSLSSDIQVLIYRPDGS
jgi:hypothetical protein